MKEPSQKKTPAPAAGQPAHVARPGLTRRRWLLAAGAGVAAGAAGLGFWLTRPTGSGHPTVRARQYTYEVVHQYPHREDAFTQGLVYADGCLYEGTGIEGQSVVRRVRLEDGVVLQQSALLPDDHMFGEGIVIWNDHIIQLTWQHHVAFLYDRQTLQRLDRRFEYEDEGWGLTHDGRHLIRSNGTHRLFFHDPDTFRVVRTLDVYKDGQPLGYLNELEYIEEEIYANVWYEEFIARIDPESGAVTAALDLTGLRPQAAMNDSSKVLNGIAYDSEHQRLFVTGKKWPTLFEIRQIPRRSEA